MYRLRLKFCRSDRLKFLSHLDLMRLWERALRRAGLPQAYSEGFSPHAKISMAAPLPVGVTSRAELMDIFLNQRISPDEFMQKLLLQLPEGISIIDTVDISLQAPSLQAHLNLAEYYVTIQTDKSPAEVTAELARIMGMEQLAWHHTRDTGERHYDLRALIDDLWLVEATGSICKIGMRLRCGSSGSGRPEQVVKALGIEAAPLSIERVKLIFN